MHKASDIDQLVTANTASSP